MKVSKHAFFLLFFAAIFPKEILAEDSSTLAPCDATNPALLNAYRLKVNPQWFFRILPKTSRLIYSAVVGHNKDGDIDGNFIYDVDKKQAIRLPGEFDGTATPDEKYYVAPSGNVVDSGFRFFPLTAGINPQSKPVITDKQMQGAYESIGVLKNSNGEDRYRVLIDNRAYDNKTGALLSSELMFKEYNLSKPSDAINSQKPKKLCGNFKYELKLPMISKDGTQLAALDPQTSTTKIYKIDGNTGDCEERTDLGVTTGKVDFSFDGDSVVFAAMKLEGSFSDGWSNAPTDDLVSNVYDYNLKTNQVKALTHFADRNALYPTFNTAGNVLTRVNEPGVKSAGDNGVWVLKLDPSGESRRLSTNWLNGKNSCAELPQYYAAAVLGALLQKLCMSDSVDSFSLQGSALMSLALDKDQCEKLAQSWEQVKDTTFPYLLQEQGKFDLNQVKKLKVSDLLAACPKDDIPKTHVFSLKTVQKPVDPNPKDPAKVIASRCAECHIGANPPGPPMRFDNLCALKPMLNQQAKDSNRTVAAEMFFRVSHAQVPPFPKAPLSPDETQSILNFVQHPETVNCSK